MDEIKLKLETIVVQAKIMKTRFKLVTRKPVFDIHPDAAKALGTTRRKWRKLMNK